MHLPLSLSAWPGDGFNDALKQELQTRDKSELPLQQGIRHGNITGSSAFSVLPISADERNGAIQAKVGIFYTSIVAGCSCADDPTPVGEINEYCEVLISIDKQDARAEVRLLD
jgi:hypothetical protein